MPWESIGSVSTGSIGEDDDWIEFCQQLAMRYINWVCGNPPPGVQIGIMSNDHDLGTYTDIGLYSDFTLPAEYVSACERALSAFDASVNWSSLRDHLDREIGDSDP